MINEVHLEAPDHYSLPSICFDETACPGATLQQNSPSLFTLPRKTYFKESTNTSFSSKGLSGVAPVLCWQCNFNVSAQIFRRCETAVRRAARWNIAHVQGRQGSGAGFWGIFDDFRCPPLELMILARRGGISGKHRTANVEKKKELSGSSSAKFEIPCPSWVTSK